MKELLLLCLRNAIANKEWGIANANMETARAGEWTCDWNESIRQADVEVQDILSAIDEHERVAL